MVSYNRYVMEGIDWGKWRARAKRWAIPAAGLALGAYGYSRIPGGSIKDKYNSAKDYFNSETSTENPTNNVPEIPTNDAVIAPKHVSPQTTLLQKTPHISKATLLQKSPVAPVETPIQRVINGKKVIVPGTSLDPNSEGSSSKIQTFLANIKKNNYSDYV